MHYFRRYLRTFLGSWVRDLMGQLLMAVIIAGLTLFLQTKVGLVQRTELRKNFLVDFLPYILAAVALLILHLVRTPWLMDRQDQQIIQQLQEQVRALTTQPRLELRLVSQPDIPGDDPQTSHRILVHNHGPGAALNVRVSLVGREPDRPAGGYHDNFPYHIRDSRGSTGGSTINEGTKDYFQLARSWKSEDNRRIIEGLNGLVEGSDGWRRVAIADDEPWRLYLTVSASNADTQELIVLVHPEPNKQTSMRVERRDLSA